MSSGRKLSIADVILLRRAVLLLVPMLLWPVGCVEARWARLGQLEGYAFSRANRRLIDYLTSESSELVR